MFVDLPGEEWRMIEGYDGLYEVSNCGRVRSWSTRGSHVRKRAAEPHLLSIEVNWRGACGVTLQRGREHHKRGVLVHQIVMTAFVGHRPAGMVSRHRDGNPGNNHLLNLEYGTQFENMADASGHGTIAHGRRLPQSKLTEEAVLDIRRRKSEGESIERLAREYGITWGSCQDAILGISWRRVADPEARV
jgi:hypothetical protein